MCLAQAGVTVVSGLARGVDACAHRAAVAAGGRTVAVLAHGLDTIYPAEHAQLASEITQHGALVKPHLPGGAENGPVAAEHERQVGGHRAEVRFPT